MTATREPGDTPPAGRSAPEPTPTEPPAGAARRGNGRDERLAAALRANLARRKARGRTLAADAEFRCGDRRDE